MEMTIEEAIIEMEEEWKVFLEGTSLDNPKRMEEECSTNKDLARVVNANTMAIDIMHKYQKITELYDYWRSGKCEYTISCMENIGKVLRDRNDD